MRGFKIVLASAAAFLALSSAPATTPAAHAQISVGIGVAPVCPYGYYGYAPYNCAPYGYYGPEWFSGGVFIGAGPWYHGHPGFYGHINRDYDPRFGYHGAFPNRGEAWHEPADHWQNFHGSHWSNERGEYHTPEEHEHYMHH